MARLTFLLLLLCVGFTVSTVVDLQKRIFNGINCANTERLYHVGLTNSVTGDGIHCGGSLIHRQWVLSAAHCCDSMYAVVKVHPGPRDVVRIEKKKIFRNHDIMLLKLENPITDIVPISLPNNSDCSTQPRAGDPVQIAGHGRYQIDNLSIPIPGQPPHLQCVTMQVSICDMRIIQWFWPNEPANNWICYEGNNVDTCWGDSGGGLIYRGKLRAVHLGSGSGIQVCSLHAMSLDICTYKRWINIKTNGPGLTHF